MFKNVKPKIFTYGFVFFSIVFLGFILMNVIGHYISKYIH